MSTSRDHPQRGLLLQWGASWPSNYKKWRASFPMPKPLPTCNLVLSFPYTMPPQHIMRTLVDKRGKAELQGRLSTKMAPALHSPYIWVLCNVTSHSSYQDWLYSYFGQKKAGFQRPLAVTFSFLDPCSCHEGRSRLAFRRVRHLAHCQPVHPWPL